MYIHVCAYIQVLPIVTVPLKDNYLTDKHVQGILDSVYPDMKPDASKTALFDICGLAKRLLEIESIPAETKVIWLYIYIYIYIYTYIHIYARI